VPLFNWLVSQTSELPCCRLIPEAQQVDAPVAGQTPVFPSQPQPHPQPQVPFFKPGTPYAAIGPQQDELLDDDE
jgi:hypothetical protein